MPPKSQLDWITQIQNSPYLESAIDVYNQGELVELLENRIAKLLGKPKALFFNKGMTAQFSVLKQVSEKTSKTAIGLHPLSHIAYDEQNSLQQLLNLQPQFIGPQNNAFTIFDLKSMQQNPAAVVFELPLRRAGFRLPDFNDLQAMSQWCHDKRIHRHMDGARLWESAPFYNKSVAEIANNFDSVYVSLYKGLGAMGGAVLAGNESFIEQCKVWRTRLGGDHYTLFPFVITALDGLDQYLSQFNGLFLRAKEIATALTAVESISVPIPQTNGFHIHLTKTFTQEQLNQLNHDANKLNEEKGIKLFSAITVCPYSKFPMIEMQVGHQHSAISTEEIFNYFKELLDYKR